MVLSFVTASAARFPSESQSIEVFGTFGNPVSRRGGVSGSTGVMGNGAKGERPGVGGIAGREGGERKMRVVTKSLPWDGVGVRSVMIKIDTNPTWRATTAVNTAPFLIFHRLLPMCGRRSPEPTSV